MEKTEAEEALIQAAINNWVTGRFNDLITAVVKEREQCEPVKIKLTADDECVICKSKLGEHSAFTAKCPGSYGWLETTFKAF